MIMIYAVKGQSLWYISDDLTLVSDKSKAKKFNDFNEVRKFFEENDLCKLYKGYFFTAGSVGD